MKLYEGLNYLDMEGQIKPTIGVDEYAAKMGKDSEIVTLSFIVNSKLAGQDLVGWLEKGYDFILDATLSEGEISPGKYVVFAEMKRRSTVPERIIEILNDLETLTALKLRDWTITIDDEDYDADEDILKQKIITSPLKYKKEVEKEEELNEFRQLSGLESKKLYVDDAYTKNLKMMAGM